MEYKVEHEVLCELLGLDKASSTECVLDAVDELDEHASVEVELDGVRITSFKGL